MVGVGWAWAWGSEKAFPTRMILWLYEIRSHLHHLKPSGSSFSLGRFTDSPVPHRKGATKEPALEISTSLNTAGKEGKGWEQVGRGEVLKLTQNLLWIDDLSTSFWQYFRNWLTKLKDFISQYEAFSHLLPLKKKDWKSTQHHCSPQLFHYTWSKQWPSNWKRTVAYWRP